MSGDLTSPEDRRKVEEIVAALKDEIMRLKASPNHSAAAMVLLLASSVAYGVEFFGQDVETSVDKLSKGIQLNAEQMLREHGKFLKQLKREADAEEAAAEAKLKIN